MRLKKKIIMLIMVVAFAIGIPVIQHTVNAASDKESVSVPATNAALFLSEEYINKPIPYASFRLQVLDGSTWNDYSVAGSMYTDFDGFIKTPNLGNGTYRFVEVGPSSTYDLVNSKGYDAGIGAVVSSQFTIDSNASEGPTVNVTNLRYKYSLPAINAGLFLYDGDTNLLLANATFKLQFLDDSTWNDYSVAGTMRTASDGFIKTPDLGNGTYRFVEIAPQSADYDLVSSNGYDTGVGSVISSEFVIDTSATKGPIVNVTNMKYRDDVRYVKGDHGAFNDEEYLDVIRGSLMPQFNGTGGWPPGEPGYHFAGWTPDIFQTVHGGDITFTATWMPYTYNITYVLDGGINDNSNPTSYTYGEGVDSFKNPTREGYTFIGWQDKDGNSITNISTTALEDKELIANWKVAVDEYKITYVLNEGTNDSSNPASYAYGEGVDSFKNPTREGYTFIGWQDKDGNNITNISTTATGDKELIAIWEKIDSNPSDIVDTIKDDKTPAEDINAPELPKTSAESELPKTGNDNMMYGAIMLLVVLGSCIGYVINRKEYN